MGDSGVGWGCRLAGGLPGLAHSRGGRELVYATFSFCWPSLDVCFYNLETGLGASRALGTLQILQFRKIGYVCAAEFGSLWREAKTQQSSLTPLGPSQQTAGIGSGTGGNGVRYMLCLRTFCERRQTCPF